MLQYIVGPAAEQAANSCVPENCPTSQPSTTCYTQPADNATAVSYPGIGIEASGIVSGDELTDTPAEPGVLYPSTASENRDMMLATVVVDRCPVDDATVVPKKRGRKPKRLRGRAAALAKMRSSTSTQDFSANAAASSRAEVTLHSSQPSLDNCNSVQEDVASKASDQHRPAPKKRGRKPKQRPEVAVVDDVTESDKSPSAKSPRTSSGPSSEPVISELATATVVVSADNDSPPMLSTSDANGDPAAGDVVSSESSDTTPRRRGRKRKDATSDKDDRRETKMRVDEDRVQSVWKVTSPTSPEYSGNVVPRIKVTNVRLSSGPTKTGSEESRDVGARERGATATTSGSQSVSRDSGSSGDRRDAKSRQPTARRTDVTNSRTTIPVLERAQEWIHATPKPSRDDWTGPVFPAREMVYAGSQNGSKDSVPAGDLSYSVPEKSPAKSGTHVNVDLHIRSQRQQLSAADGAVRNLVMPRGDVTKTGVVCGPRSQAAAVAVNAASELMYVIGRGDGHGPPTVAAARPHSREHALPVNHVAGRSVAIEGAAVPSPCSTFDRQMLTSTVCSFANDPRTTGPYVTKRVSFWTLGCVASFRFFVVRLFLF